MKKIVYWFAGIVIATGSFMTGYLIRQPQVNKLKKQVELLQRDNRKLLAIIDSKQKNYQELLIQHKALKALQFRKKSELKEQLTENLVMQYAIREYLTLLLKCGKHNHELEKDEIIFFKSFEKVIDGKKLYTSDKVKIREYIMDLHRTEIKQFKECEYAEVLEELQDEHEQLEFIFCSVKVDKKKKPQYYITDDTTVMAGDLVYVPSGKNKITVAKVITVDRYIEDDAPIEVANAPRIIRKCQQEELLLPVNKNK